MVLFISQVISKNFIIQMDPSTYYLDTDLASELISEGRLASTLCRGCYRGLLNGMNMAGASHIGSWHGTYIFETAATFANFLCPFFSVMTIAPPCLKFEDIKTTFNSERTLHNPAKK